MSMPRLIACPHCGSPPDFGPDAFQARNRFLEEMGAECAQDWQKIERLLARIERIRVAFQAIRDGGENANSKLYRVLAAEFPHPPTPNDTGEKDAR